MTVKQIAEIAQCGEDTVRVAIRKRFPGLLKNGVPTDLKEFEAILIMGDLRKPGFVTPSNGGPIGGNENHQLKKLQLSGALVKSLESVFGKPGAAARVDFLIGFPSKDDAALIVGRRVLEKQARERQQLKFPVEGKL